MPPPDRARLLALAEECEAATLAFAEVMAPKPLGETFAQRNERRAHLLKYGPMFAAALRALAEESSDGV